MIRPSQSAADFRENLLLDADQPVPDLIELIKSSGYDYFERSFPEDFYGFTQMVDSYRFLIGFNSRNQFGNAFKRFTLAHELGHISMHHDILRNGLKHLSFSNGNSDIQIEREADQFAACFLMPPKAFAAKCSDAEFSPMEIKRLAGFYDVSEIAAAIHFVSHSDLACSLIVADASGKTKWENRSPKMEELVGRVRYVRKTDVPASSAVSDWLRGRQIERRGVLPLIDWMPDLRNEVEAEEWVMKTPNDLYLTLLTPLISEVDLGPD